MTAVIELVQRWRIEAATLPESSSRRLALFQCANQLDAGAGNELRAALAQANRADKDVTEALQAIEDVAHMRSLALRVPVVEHGAAILCDLWGAYESHGLTRADLGLFTSPASDALDAARLLDRLKRRH